MKRINLESRPPHKGWDSGRSVESMVAPHWMSVYRVVQPRAGPQLSGKQNPQPQIIGGRIWQAGNPTQEFRQAKTGGWVHTGIWVMGTCSAEWGTWSGCKAWGAHIRRPCIYCAEVGLWVHCVSGLGHVAGVEYCMSLVCAACSWVIGTRRNKCRHITTRKDSPFLLQCSLQYPLLTKLNMFPAKEQYFPVFSSPLQKQAKKGGFVTKRQ